MGQFGALYIFERVLGDAFFDEDLWAALDLAREVPAAALALDPRFAGDKALSTFLIISFTGLTLRTLSFTFAAAAFTASTVPGGTRDFPSAALFPIIAPATPPITAPTGPATTPPITAPVTPPAVCFVTGTFASLVEDVFFVFVIFLRIYTCFGFAV